MRVATRAWRRSLCLASLVACLAGSSHAAGQYPLVLILEATADTTTTAVTSSITVRVDRLMEANRQKRVIDALKYGGYVNFLPALRALPPIGTISVNAKTVDIRYADERQEATAAASCSPPIALCSFLATIRRRRGRDTN